MNETESPTSSQETSSPTPKPPREKKSAPKSSQDSSEATQSGEAQTAPVQKSSESPQPPKDRASKPASEKEAPSNAPDSPQSGGNDGNTPSGPENGGTSRPPRKRSGNRNRKYRRNSNRDQDSPKGTEGESADITSESSEESENDRREAKRRARRNRKERRKEQREKEREREAAMLEAAPAVEVEGLTEISPKGFGFLRLKERGYQQHPDDVFITPEVVRIHGLRDGLLVKCESKQGIRGPQLTQIISINGKEPETYHNLPYFEELTAINPNKRLALETTPDRMTTRVIDMMTPIGRGQRGLIVSPPRTGKTTFLEHIAEGILENYEGQMHLIIMLIDERPEEMTNFQRLFPKADFFASSNDSDIKDHTRMAQLAIERAKRLVEAGEHVFILLDSITRLARAFNNAVGGGKGGKKRGTQSGGIAVGALEIPRKLFAAARNTREGGSLTIIATALIQTNFKMDEAIFQEFKGTGNMELVLDRQLAQNYVYPAVDINRSGTRREELLLPQHMLEKIYVIRRGLSGYKPIDAMEWLLKCMERYPSNAQMLMDIKTNALA